MPKQPPSHADSAPPFPPAPPAPSAPPAKRRLFTDPDGRSLGITFALVSSLFLIWGFCNGMIDVMDKHFQEELHLTLSQSAWVQFAHYLGYFLMALPAGWLAGKLGYKGGIITGLLMVAVGGLWFIPATQIAAFWAFLLGVCFIAAGLTFLETVANPYTTVLGPKEFAATRINLAQSCNGIGWVLGPIAGAMFFYSTNAEGASTGAQTLWIPYTAVAAVVLVLAVVFYKARLPDLKMPDDYKLDEKPSAPAAAPVSIGGTAAGGSRRLSLLLLWGNILVLASAVGMIASAITSIFSDDGGVILSVCIYAAVALAVIGSVTLAVRSHRLTRRSIWAHPHFSSATIAQFFYNAAQAGIFAYFINYMTSQAPVEISNKAAATLASVGFLCFLAGRFLGSGLLKKFPPHRVLGLFGALNIGVCLLVVLKLGWVSMIAVFASYFFMSIMFPTIFALGIFGLGSRAKKASAFIVMSIMGGAIMPKLMGHIADQTDLSIGFVVPLTCFGIVAAYGFFWKKLSNAQDTAASPDDAR
ncbi:MAG: MFS transporter [Opitutaceae bacterium]|jgi:FHS family L-fucose permease-like MFS transporter|nr:MFS transporter [Opitutaceae bacterium]